MYEPIEILLVEDNPHDARLTIEVLKESRMININHLHHVSDGKEAVDFLKQEGKYEGQAKPDVILLDINLPKMDGIEVLKYIKSNPHTKNIPVIIMTTSSQEGDIKKAYDLSVNAYVNKPLDFDNFVDVVTKVSDFWFSIVKLPKIDK